MKKLMYRVVLFFKFPDEHDEHVFYAQIEPFFQKKYIFFGPKVFHVTLDISSLHPEPMTKEDAEFTSKLAYLTFRKKGLVRVQLEEVEE